jgi:hypothetical protein
MTDAALPDLARRDLGAVVAANDEFFAARENLVLPHPAGARAEFGDKGKEHDGWETRRRRSPGHDWAIVRLGARCPATSHPPSGGWSTARRPEPGPAPREAGRARRTGRGGRPGPARSAYWAVRIPVSARQPSGSASTTTLSR